MHDSARLARKLKRNPAAILGAREVRLLACAAEQLWRESFPRWSALNAEDGLSLRVGVSIRWGSLGARCRQAREQMQLDEKAAAKHAGLPWYRVKAIEHGRFGEFQPDHAWRYFESLGIKAWVGRWCRANAELAEHVGIRPARSRPAPRDRFEKR
ncbi:MAG: hypothetical protein L0Z52_13070 [Acidobacteria bacterium]|nr:hypothetical protein [Acidobacteriota bacterium]